MTFSDNQKDLTNPSKQTLNLHNPAERNNNYNKAFLDYFVLFLVLSRYGGPADSKIRELSARWSSGLEDMSESINEGAEEFSDIFHEKTADISNMMNTGAQDISQIFNENAGKFSSILDDTFQGIGKSKLLCFKDRVHNFSAMHVN